MIKIEHAAVWTTNLESMKSFYITYFDGISNGKYVNPAKRYESYFISFEGGARLELMHKPDAVEHPDRVSRLGIAHLAFSAGSRERVLELTERLRRDGYTVFSEPRTTGDGYFESGVLDPEGNAIEITI